MSQQPRTHARIGHRLHRRLRVEPLEDRRLLALTTVNTELDLVNPGDEFTSLREAIVATNTLPGPDEIDFDFGHDGPATILLEQGELEITEALTVTGDGPELLTVNAQEQSRIFNITAETGDFTIAGLTLTGGMTTGDDDASNGGAIRSLTTDHLTISNSTVSHNSTAGFSTRGGGIYAAGDLTVADSTISKNDTQFGRGGGIAARDVTVTGSTVSGNNARHGGGGGISAQDVVVTNSAVSGNSTLFGRGGGISARDVAVTGSMISGNSTRGEMYESSTTNGGGIHASGNVTITESTVSNNRISGYEDSSAFGGGLYVQGNVTITDSTVSGNTATAPFAYGGGVFSYGSAVTVTSSTISDNSASDGGGGMSAWGTATVTITDSAVSGNSADFYGGVFGSTVIVISSVISGNSATRDAGGGISGGTMVVTSSTISGNSAAGDGGGVSGYAATVAFSTITGNSAGSEGAGIQIWSDLGTVTITHSIVAGNIDRGTAPDLRPSTSPPSVNYSLIGDRSGTELTEAPVGSADANGNLIGGPINDVIDPLLAPLANNGGPTQTHRLLPGSPAIDAGDPMAMAGVGSTPHFDQRGSPFTRVYDGDAVDGARIDMGAFELQPQPGDVNGDLTFDFGDLTPFVLALTNPSAYEATYPDLDRVFLCDVSGDGLCNFGDLQPFADLLVGEEGSAVLNVTESGQGLAIMPDVTPVMSKPSQRVVQRGTASLVEPVRDQALITWLSSFALDDADGGPESELDRGEADEFEGLPTSVTESVFQGMGG